MSAAELRALPTSKAVAMLQKQVVGSEKMDVGWYKEISNAGVFVASRQDIENFDRLHWAVLRVLSEKYGCLIRSQEFSGSTLRFSCRDRRTIIVRQFKTDDWMMFHARQFDNEGRELIVDQNRIVGYGERRI